MTQPNTQAYYKTAIFKITAKTNLHVGAGSADYGIIDNLVQRDVLTEFPTINASSLKGALRAFFTYKHEEGNENLQRIFGGKARDEKETKGKVVKQQAGLFRFFDAKIMAIPIPDDKQLQLYTLISCEACKKEFQEAMENFNIPQLDLDYFSNLKALEEFKELVSDFELPIVARNYLENGESKNLWYEQLVPRESVFWFAIAYPCLNQADFEFFKDSIKDNLVQIGANASIGYGFCKIEEITTKAKENESK